MSAQKKLLNAPKGKLEDRNAKAMILQCLYVAVGEGTSAPQIQRFISVQSAKSFSAYRLEEMLDEFESLDYITCKTITTKGGRIYRKYEITPCGLIHLISMVKNLTRDVRKVYFGEFAEVFRVTDALLASAKEAKLNPVHNEMNEEKGA